MAAIRIRRHGRRSSTGRQMPEADRLAGGDAEPAIELQAFPVEADNRGVGATNADAGTTVQQASASEGARWPGGAALRCPAPNLPLIVKERFYGNDRHNAGAPCEAQARLCTQMARGPTGLYKTARFDAHENGRPCIAIYDRGEQQAPDDILGKSAEMPRHAAEPRSMATDAVDTSSPAIVVPRSVRQFMSISLGTRGPDGSGTRAISRSTRPTAGRSEASIAPEAPNSECAAESGEVGRCRAPRWRNPPTYARESPLPRSVRSRRFGQPSASLWLTAPHWIVNSRSSEGI
jgi:hypothetical protein